MRFNRVRFETPGFQARGAVQSWVGVLGFRRSGFGEDADVVGASVLGGFVMSGGCGGVWVRGRAGVVVLLLVGLVLGVGGTAGGDDGFSDISEAGVHESAVRALLADGVFEGTECRTGRFCSGGFG